MRKLMAGVLLALWSSVAPAQTYDTLDQAVVGFTNLLVLTAKADRVEVEKGMYVSSCDFHDRGGGPYLRLSKHLAGLFSAALRRHEVRVVATQGEGEEMFLRAEWTREVETGKLFLEAKVMRLAYMNDVDRNDVDRQVPESVAVTTGHVSLAGIDGSHLEADPGSECNPEPIVTSGRTPITPVGNTLDDVAKAFEKATEDNTVAAFELVAKHFPGTYYGELAQQRADTLKAGNEARKAEAKRRAEEKRRAEAEAQRKAEARRKAEAKLKRQAADPSNLFAAVNAGNIARIKALLGAGANANAKNPADNNARPLHTAAVLGNVGSVNALLAGGADPNATADGGWTPLHSAAWKGKANAIRALLERGANPNAKDKRGQAVLRRALAEGHIEAVDALLDGGADLSAALTPVNKTMVVTAKTSLLRLPSLAAKQAGSVENGQKIEVLAQAEGWYQVRQASGLAYLQSNFLRDLQCRTVTKYRKERVEEQYEKLVETTMSGPHAGYGMRACNEVGIPQIEWKLGRECDHDEDLTDVEAWCERCDLVNCYLEASGYCVGTRKKTEKVPYEKEICE